jgi:hypothetical protein
MSDAQEWPANLIPHRTAETTARQNLLRHHLRIAWVAGRVGRHNWNIDDATPEHTPHKTCTRNYRCTRCRQQTTRRRIAHRLNAFQAQLGANLNTQFQEITRPDYSDESFDIRRTRAIGI